MRLTCPNCGAQYEVPVDVIPQAGRDVQCSNCGHTWFQVHPDDDRDLADELETPVPDTDWSEDSGDSSIEDAVSDLISESDEHFEPEWEQGPEPEPQPDPAPDAAEPDFDEPEHEEDQGIAEEAGDESSLEDEPPQVAQRRELAPEVADVLRQEAEHEARLRAEEAGGLETQPDLGLDEPGDEGEKRASEARERMRRIRGLPDLPAEPAEEVLGDRGSRSEILPDIEEINSTLRATEDRLPGEGAHGGATPAMKRRRGFRLGFGVVLLVTAAALLVYVFNAEIVAQFPEAAPYVEQFMDKTNDARIWLDTQVTQMMLWLDEKAGAAGGNVD